MGRHPAVNQQRLRHCDELGGTNGVGATPSQAYTCTPGQLITQAFGIGNSNYYTGSSGGTQRFNANGGNLVGLIMQESPVSATFAAVANASGNWSTLGAVLS